MADIINTQFLFQNLVEENTLLIQPAFAVFLITVAAYLFGFLVYGGYLSAFAGSIGNIPFAFSDLTIVDILSILPIAIITFLNKIIHGLKDVFIFLVVYLFTPICLGLIIRLKTGQFIFPPYTTAAIITGQIIWTGTASFVGYKNIRYLTFGFFVAIFIITAAWVFIFGSISTSGQPAIVPPPNSWVLLLNSVLAFFYFVVGLLGLFVLGFVTAETVVERRALSQVSRLVLRQPLPFLGIFEQTITETKKQIKKSIFSKTPTTEVINHDLYTYCCIENKPLFMVSSFHKFSLFYVPENRENKKMHGHLVSISSELIYAIELVIRQRNSGGEVGR